MTSIRALTLMLLIVAAASLLFWGVLHQISGFWLDIALRPEVRVALQKSAEDQRRLRRLDPAHSAEYRTRFDETQRLARRLELLRMNREEMIERFERFLVVAFAATATLAAAALWLHQRRAQRRERAQFLKRVTLLQETARRHAHEIKGPLTAARLELERFGDLARGGASPEELERAHESVSEELARLTKFTREFSTFGGVGTPVLRRESLGQMIEEFCRTFTNAWPMALEETGGDAVVCADRDMLRQVLVNLCTNSAGAGATRVAFAIVKNGARVMLDVRDDGSGIPESLRANVFDPYVTTRRIGEGMGLGLAISRKVLLDHGGDLALHETSEHGTTFRITFGEPSCN